MRKLMSMVLAVCLCLLSFGAFADVTENGMLPIVDEPYTLTIWASIPGGMDDYTNNPTTAWFEEKTGVHINWIEVANSEASTKFNTSIASGEYPDIYMHSDSGAMLLQYAEDGVIIPLNDLIDEYGYFIKQRLEEHPEVLPAITAPDGNIYSFPRIDYILYSSAVNKLWVYNEWLQRYMEETGSEQPNTLDELHEMLLFFRDNDMNGNGDTTDEIVMTGQYNYGADGGNPIYYLLNAFDYLPSYPSTFYFNEDDQFVTNATSDKVREGLKYINNMYNEGLIAEETFVQDLVTFRSITTTTKDKVVVATAGAPFPFRLLTRQVGVENAVDYGDYECLEPLARVDSGETIIPARDVNQLSMTGYITTACEHPEIAMRWMDYWYSNEIINYTNWGGEEGIGWEWQDVPSLGGDDKAVVSLLDSKTRDALWNPDFVGVRWTTEETVQNQAAVGVEEIVYRIKYGRLYDQYAKYNNIPYVVWCNDPDVVAEFNELGALIGNYITTSLNEFVLGIRDVNDDADWNAYIDALDKMGIDRYSEVAKEYYGK